MLEENVYLSDHSNFKIGGPAKFFALVKTEGEAVQAAREAKEKGLPIFILGGGTNILIPDEGLEAVVIKTGFGGISLEEGNKLRVGSGVLVSDLLNFCIENEFSGFEWAGGLPGTVGGAVFGNAGAFGGEIKDNLLSVKAIDLGAEKPKMETYDHGQCCFEYRNSFFKKNSLNGKRMMILEVLFQMQKGNREEIKERIQEKIDYRESRQPLEYPNIGSIFKNISWDSLSGELQEKFKDVKKTDPFDVLPTAAVIHDAGLKEMRVGGAMVSPKHPNFIINFDRATAKEINELANKVKEKIEEMYGIELEREVIFL
ncbi:MAG: UDP-N-acetylmuramate dehydrogenase [bacterium]|nr:UDP-N-acetylmuramate dehydrogenase [bacterium]MDZ4209565.1 UDP-N-acetylmuramate dehydrogenase [Candidatus Curtissbacteria bacterium]